MWYKYKVPYGTKSAGKLGGSTSTKKRVLAYFGPSAISAALIIFFFLLHFLHFLFFFFFDYYFPPFFPSSLFWLRFLFPFLSISPVEKHSPFPPDLCFSRSGAPTLWVSPTLRQLRYSSPLALSLFRSLYFLFLSPSLEYLVSSPKTSSSHMQCWTFRNRTSLGLNPRDSSPAKNTLRLTLIPTVNGRIAIGTNRLVGYLQTSGLSNTSCGPVSLALDAGAVKSSASTPASIQPAARANHPGANVSTQPRQSEWATPNEIWLPWRKVKIEMETGMVRNDIVHARW